MLKHLLVILFAVSSVACNHQGLTSADEYIISREDSLLKVKLAKRNAPPFVAGFYSTFNLVLDTSGKIFLHRKSIKSMCTTDTDQSKPDFLNLRPSDFIQIAGDNLHDLIRDNVLDNEKNRLYVYIASPVDTIRQKEFYRLIAYFRKVRFARYIIRKTTEEEDAVIKAVKGNVDYYHSEVDWKEGFGNVSTDSLYSAQLIYN